MNKIKFCIIGLCWTFLSNVYAESPDLIIQKKMAAIHTMHAEFSQIVRAKHRVISKSKGTMVLAKPNQFRWEIKRPMAQTVVADGRKVWVYDVDLEQVTVSKQTRNLGAAGVLFLSQEPDAIRRDFTVQFKQHGTSEVFDLHAKSAKANFEKVRVIFDNNILQTIELDDQVGQHIIIHLSQVAVNQPEPAARFQFRVPKGVDVVQQ
ncbi:MAG: outer membrane lipoprotein chaperone LolA [Gammaproteobacteria bacterium]